MCIYGFGCFIYLFIYYFLFPALTPTLQAANPFFKLLTMLMEFAGGPPGMPPFASYILQRIWEVRYMELFGTSVFLFISPPLSSLVMIAIKGISVPSDFDRQF